MMQMTLVRTLAIDMNRFFST